MSRSESRRRFPRVLAGAARAAVAVAGAVAGSSVADAQGTTPSPRPYDGAEAHERGPRHEAARARMTGPERGVQHEEHLAALAEQLGIDPAQLETAMTSLRAAHETQRAAMHEALADATPEERRAAMLEARDAHRSALADALGVDPAALPDRPMAPAHDGPRQHRHQHAGQPA